MEKIIDMNCDMGESYGHYTIGMDREVIKYITSANIACGYHAGDPNIMERTVLLCKEHNVAIGAHPGLPDLIGFGRRHMEISLKELSNYIIYQIGALRAFVEIHGLSLQHVKLHGSLYNKAAEDYKIASSIAKTILAYDENLIFVVLANSEMENAAAAMNMRYACEIFSDRNYNSNGTLVSRQQANALIEDSAYATDRIINVIEKGRITAIDGKDFEINYHTVCVHGDNKEAINFSRKIQEKLIEKNIRMKPMGQIIEVK